MAALAFDPAGFSPVKWDADLTNKYRENVDSPTNVALETLLKDLQEDVRCGRLAVAERRLNELQASIRAKGVVGPEATVREAVAISLNRTASLLTGNHAAETPAANPLVRFWQQYVGRPVYQEVDSWVLLNTFLTPTTCLNTSWATSFCRVTSLRTTAPTTKCA